MAVGELRSRKIVGYWEVPWDFPEARIPHQRFAQQFIDKMGKMGWRLERVLRLYKEPTPAFTEKGTMATWVFEAIFSRPVRKIKFELPDDMVPWLLAHPKLGPMVTDIS